ncbi:acyl-CoA dehydrogenase [Halioglobus maricola]|uniref:Acyl-CoA dehydrogenase n=1 Tax=Halioglobus maricola TaxID=2601894 RepID=A0A5P9NJQ1_9GAMM|nr:acyl-CoA dehydrogenase family protein [Halioglobus maricola]QFU75198.1 acyl-CoA dehydrogenase [Halioglobus maricola]
MIPRTVYEPEHELFRESVRKFLETEVEPYHQAWEKAGQVDKALWQKAGAQGFLVPGAPEQYGGVGVDYRYNSIINEEVARGGHTGIGWSLHSDISVPYILNFGSEEQKEKYIPGCISGEIVTAIAMTEPGAGSDLQGIKTTAIRDGDDFIINGSKTFITNGQHADLVVVVAKTDPSKGAAGTSLFLVEANTPGFEKGTNLDKLGMKAQDTSELFFNDVRVPGNALLGEEGKGFVYLMQELPQERLQIAEVGIASAETALDYTTEYVSERKAFGKSIADFQNTQFKLAEMDTEISVCRVFIDRCLELHLDGKLDPVTAAKAKLHATELQGRVLDQCLQLHGGYGFMWEYPIARAYADSRVQRIYGGTSEVMKLIIGRSRLN